MDATGHRLDEGMKKWIIKTAHKEFWRVAGHIELDDLIQDGYVCYAKCNQRYPADLEQRHFMALVRTTYINHIRTLSAARHKRVDWTVSSHPNAADPNTALEILGGSVHEEQTLAAMLSSLPRELKELLVILGRDAKSIPLLTAKDTTTPDGKPRPAERETWNEYFARLIGADPKQIDVEALFRQYLG